MGIVILFIGVCLFFILYNKMPDYGKKTVKGIGAGFGLIILAFVIAFIVIIVKFSGHHS